jgi:hypothetical protein
VDDAPPLETDAPLVTPEEAQAKRDRAFAKQRRDNTALASANAAQAAEIAALKARLPVSPPVAPVPDDPAVQAIAAREAAKAVQQLLATEAAQARQAAWETQAAALRDTHADYDAVLEASDVPLPLGLLQSIQESAQGAQLAYHLATHPDDAAALSVLSPAAALKALGKLEARFEATGTAPTRTPPVVPKPRPLTPVGSPGASADTRRPDQLPFEEYTAWYVRTYGSR